MERPHTVHTNYMKLEKKVHSNVIFVSWPRYIGKWTPQTQLRRKSRCQKYSNCGRKVIWACINEVGTRCFIFSCLKGPKIFKTNRNWIKVVYFKFWGPSSSDIKFCHTIKERQAGEGVTVILVRWSIILHFTRLYISSS